MKKAIQFISVSDGQKLSGTLVLPERPLAMVCIFHGMVEHRGRYQMFADELANESLAVMLIDQRGHGESLYDGQIKGHFSDSDGWNRNLRDLHDFIQQTNEPFNLPVFIFAHSMGTLFARSYLKRYESAVDGIYMTGCVAQNPNLNVAMLVARIGVFFFGKRRPNRFLLDQTFATFNRHIDHPVTAFDWLSYDTRNVNAYIQDDLCGFPLSNQGFVDLFELTEDAYSAEGWRVMRPNLPIRFVSGTDDPVFLPGGLSESVRHLTDVGYRWVETRLIDGCRHEVLHEVKRDEVIADFLRWINYHLKNLNDIG